MRKKLHKMSFFLKEICLFVCFCFLTVDLLLKNPTLLKKTAHLIILLLLNYVGVV